MDSLELLWGGLQAALTPTNLLYAALGVFLGTFVGVLPGIGPAMTVALLLPITYNVSPSAAFIMFAGIFYGGMYGGSTTSILLNTPGEAASIVTALEGNKMAKAGRGAAALGTAAIGSFVAGTIATLLLALVAPTVVKLAIAIGPADYFALALLAFLAVATVLGASPLRGLASLCLGLFLGLVGTDLLTGQQRFNFGVPQLADGIDVVIVAVALFAVGEALHVASRLRQVLQNLVQNTIKYRSPDRSPACRVDVQTRDATEPHEGRYDRVLVDPPCSDLGTLASRPDARWRKAGRPEALAELQQQILAAGAAVLKPGGTLVYSTCTISPVENEQVVTGFLAVHEDFAVADLGADAPVWKHPTMPQTLQTLPHRDRTDGFFIAKLVRA